VKFDLESRQRTEDPGQVFSERAAAPTLLGRNASHAASALRAVKFSEPISSPSLEGTDV